MQAPWVMVSAVDALAFEKDYTEHILASTLRQGDIVVLDNLSANRVVGFNKLLPPAVLTFNTCRLTRPISIRLSNAVES